jgi:hypothetical protein
MGKSTIAQTVAERCEECGTLGASFFFSRAGADQSNGLLLFATVAYQLAKFSEAFKDELLLVLSKNPDAGRQGIQPQLRKLIVGPLGGVMPILSVVVDALDECTDGRAQEIIRILASMIHELRGVKFLITSRPEFPISSQFQSQLRLSAAKHYVLHDMERSIVQSDIRRFLVDQFQDIHGRRFALTEKQLDILVEKSAGLFIYASTAVKFIKAQHGRAPKDLLELLIGDRTATDVAPYSDLDNLYLHVLRHTGLSVDSVLVISTIILLREPLPAAALERMLCLPDGSVTTSLLPLGSLLAIPDCDSDPIRVIHPSFPDFLIQSEPRRCVDDRFFVDSPIHHIILARRCFAWMHTLFGQGTHGIEGESTYREHDCGIPVDLQYAGPITFQNVHPTAVS